MGRVEIAKLFDILVLVLAATLLGTKGAYLFLILLVIVDLFFRQKKRVLTYTIVLFAILMFSLFSKQIAMNMIKFMNLPPEIYGGRGPLTMFASKRDLLLNDALEYMQAKWNTINYLIGGTDFRFAKVEIEIVDIFLFFGLVGLFVYFVFLKSHFVIKKNSITNSLLVLVLLIGTLSGNLVPSITNATFFAITFLYLRNQILNKD